MLLLLLENESNRSVFVSDNNASKLVSEFDFSTTSNCSNIQHITLSLLMQ